MTKTNVMRLLEQAKIEYTAHEYEFDENQYIQLQELINNGSDGLWSFTDNLV